VVRDSDFDVEVKLAVYRQFADTGQRPSVDDVASVRMASPFSGVPTQHVVVSEARQYFAKTWYSNRLLKDSRRPQPGEMRDIFAGLGLEGDFWDPRADRFG